MKETIFNNLQINDVFVLNNYVLKKTDWYEAKELSKNLKITLRLFQKVKKVTCLKDILPLFPIFKAYKQEKKNNKVLLSSTDGKEVLVTLKNNVPVEIKLNNNIIKQSDFYNFLF